MRFLNVHHNMFNGTDGKSYIVDSCSFIHDFYLQIVVLKLTLNSKTHDSEQNAEILENNLKADYHFDFPNNERTVVSDTKNDAAKVYQYFSEDL